MKIYQNLLPINSFLFRYKSNKADRRRAMKKKLKKKPGITMIETLVVVAIVGLLILLLILLLGNQKSRAQDARRKADLENIKISFEDYFNDKSCYPPEGSLQNCGSEDLDPYLKSIPCDPVSREPYVYAPESNCSGYKTYAILEDKTDPIISVLRCDGVNGCGSTAGVEYNYGVSIGTSLYGPNYNDPAPSPTPTPTPTPTPPTYVYACDRSGVCNEFSTDNPRLENCPITYLATNCENACDEVENRCL